jgi:hypothetical protein
MTALVISPETLHMCSIYILVEWPYVHDLMEQPWFKIDCIPCPNGGELAEPALAYFIPMERFAEAIQQGLICLQV